MRYLLIYISILLLAGCQSSQKVIQKSSTPPQYSIVYLIHGDANYLYHDAEGHALQADEEVLKEAKKIAEQAVKGEVLIFHQKPERKILWLFPKKDRTFLYYKNGSLVTEQRYSPSSPTDPFKREAELYEKYHNGVIKSSSSKRVLLYFGHEVPHRAGKTYHYSRPGADFNTNTFADGIQSFTKVTDNPFDLTVLSTCNNGTPGMIHALAPLTRHVLASPQNLHLSHIDTGALALLNKSGQESVSAAQVADSMAVETYQRLSSFLQTVITLTNYDISRIESYLPSFNQSYKEYLTRQVEGDRTPDNTDCANFSFFKPDVYAGGIKSWYKAPRFGQQKKTPDYSGWGCAETK